MTTATHSPAHPAPTRTQLTRTRTVINLGVWALTAAVIVSSVRTAAPFIDAHSTGAGTGLIMAAGIDAAFVLALQADSVLSRYGASPGPWATALRVVTGLSTAFLNVAPYGLKADIVGALIHAIPPVVLMVLAEAGPAYRRSLLTLEDRPGEPVSAVSEPVSDDALTPAQPPLTAEPVTPQHAPEEAPATAPEPVVSEPVSEPVLTDPEPEPEPEEAPEPEPVKLSRDDALVVVAELHADGQPQSAAVKATGWSAGWVAGQYKALDARSESAAGGQLQLVAG